MKSRWNSKFFLFWTFRHFSDNFHASFQVSQVNWTLYLQIFQYSLLKFSSSFCEKVLQNKAIASSTSVISTDECYPASMMRRLLYANLDLTFATFAFPSRSLRFVIPELIESQRECELVFILNSFIYSTHQRHSRLKLYAIASNYRRQSVQSRVSRQLDEISAIKFKQKCTRSDKSKLSDILCELSHSFAYLSRLARQQYNL